MLNNDFAQPPNSPTVLSWKIAGATSIGKSHLDSGLANQDSFFYQQTPNFSVAVVCDGAGSATMSEKGAYYFAQAVGDFLVKNALTFGDYLAQAIDNTALITIAFANIRHNLATQIPAEFSLKDYHSTVTAILILPQLNQALLLQIGDSPLLASQFMPKNQQLDYFDGLRVYGEEDKTEYINETHFITQDNWQDFLRIEWLDTKNVDCIALMSDGCADLVLAGGTAPRQVYRPFFANVLFNLLQSDNEEMGNTLLQTALDNPATYRLTGDDKTLIVLVKNPQNWANLEPLVEMPTQNDNSLSENLQPSPSLWVNENGSKNNLSNFNAQSTANTVENVNFNPMSPAESSQNLHLELKLELAPPEKLPEPMPSTNSQQTKKLILAGGGMVLGILALAGLNRDWLSERFSAKTTTSPNMTATAISTPVATTIAISEPTTTQLPTSISHDINTPFTLHSLNEQPLSMVIGFPDGKIVTPIATPVKVWENTDTSRAIFAHATCVPLLTTDQNVFASFNVTINPKWQYAKCQVQLVPMHQTAQKQWQKSPLPPEITEVVLPHGLSVLFPVQKTAETVSATATTVQPLQGYFLPN